MITLGGQAGAGNGSIGTIHPLVSSNSFTETTMLLCGRTASWFACHSSSVGIAYDSCQQICVSEIYHPFGGSTRRFTDQTSIENRLGYIGKPLMIMDLSDLVRQLWGRISCGVYGPALNLEDPGGRRKYTLWTFGFSLRNGDPS